MCLSITGVAIDALDVEEFAEVSDYFSEISLSLLSRAAA
jgi:hypothetical protein